MKRAILFAGMLLFSLAMCTARANDGEWTGTVGCQHCQFEKETGAADCGAALKVGEKVYTLKGEKVSKEFKKGGEWTIKGKMADDGKSIEVSEMTRKE